MADFSKQYVENYDPDFGWDFDLEEEFEKLSKGEWTVLICEGFGFIGIQKLLDGTKQCIYKNHSTGEFKNIDYYKITPTTYKDIWL